MIAGSRMVEEINKPRRRVCKERKGAVKYILELMEMHNPLLRTSGGKLLLESAEATLKSSHRAFELCRDLFIPGRNQLARSRRIDPTVPRLNAW
jgi:hypothetical protein